MAHVGVSVTKRTAFRDATQEFTNTYHYRWTGLDPGEALAESLLDRLVVIEKTLHSSNITFVQGRVWNAGGTIQENDMILEKPLSGVGSASPVTNMDRERCILYRWRAGVDSLGRPVYLRKFYHSDSFLGAGIADIAALLENRVGFSSAARGILVGKVADLNPISFNNGSTIGELIAESGRGITGAVEAHKYLEHHQLGDQWRG